MSAKRLSIVSKLEDAIFLCVAVVGAAYFVWRTLNYDAGDDDSRARKDRNATSLTQGRTRPNRLPSESKSWSTLPLIWQSADSGLDEATPSASTYATVELGTPSRVALLGRVSSPGGSLQNLGSSSTPELASISFPQSEFSHLSPSDFALPTVRSQRPDAMIKYPKMFPTTGVEDSLNARYPGVRKFPGGKHVNHRLVSMAPPRVKIHLPCSSALMYRRMRPLKAIMDARSEEEEDALSDESETLEREN